MVISVRTLRRSSFARFLVRHMRDSSIVLSTGKKVYLHRDENGIINSYLVHVGKLTNFEKIELEHIHKIIREK